MAPSGNGWGILCSLQDPLITRTNEDAETIVKFAATIEQDDINTADLKQNAQEHAVTLPPFVLGEDPRKLFKTGPIVNIDI